MLLSGSYEPKRKAAKFPLSSGKSVTSHIPGIGAVRKEVAADIKMSPRTLERHNKWSRVLGLDLVKDITGTLLDTTDQLDILVSLKNRVELYETKKWQDYQESQIRKSYTSKYRNLWDRFISSVEAGKFREVHADC